MGCILCNCSEIDMTDDGCWQCTTCATSAKFQAVEAPAAQKDLIEAACNLLLKLPQSHWGSIAATRLQATLQLQTQYVPCYP